MPNVLGNYNVPYYAPMALEVLTEALGTAPRVNRSYEDSRTSFGKGDVVRIRKPSRIVTQNAPIPAANVADLNTESVNITLNVHKEAKYPVTDLDLVKSGDALFRDHIRPAAHAIARDVEQAILGLSYLFPHCQQINSATVDQAPFIVADTIMAQQGVPELDRHYAASARVWQKWLGLTAFTQMQGAGDNGINTQMTGKIGPKFGFSPYRSTNLLGVGAQTSPTITAGATNGAATKGATQIAVDATTLTGTFLPGMVIQIGTAAATAGKAYNDQLYAITASVTAAGNAATLSISPPLRADVADNTTFTQKVNASAAAFETELAYHRDALALVMAPLPMDLKGGVEAQTVGNEWGISCRLRAWYDAHAMTHYYSLDALFGVQVLDPDMGVRGIVV